jgi:hypothetical protein
MNGWQTSAADADRSRRGRRGVLLMYLGAGATLAILRVSVLAWIEQRSALHQMSKVVNDSLLFLSPESLLAEYTRIGRIHFENRTQHFLFWSAVLTLGSFIIATPILLLGRLKQWRR